MSQEHLARSLGVSQSAVAKWLRGSPPRADALYRVAKLLGMSFQASLESIPQKPATHKNKTEFPFRPGCISSSRIVSAAKFHMLPASQIERALFLALECKQQVEISGGTIHIWHGLKADGPEYGFTGATNKVTTSEVESGFAALMQRASKFLADPGSKSALADSLGVPRQRVSDWLKGRQKPNADTTLALLWWVEQREQASK